MFKRWNWIDREEFRQDFGYTDISKYTDVDIAKAVYYGCTRVDLECGGTISSILADKEFPGALTKDQADTVLEAASWCANHAIKQGLTDFLRGSSSVSLGQVSTGQTNPEEPDYFPPFLRNKLVGAGLVKLIHTGNIPEEEDFLDPARYFRGKDEEFYPPSLDYLKSAYIAKQGHNSLQSLDKSIVIKPVGGVYDGVDLSVEWKNMPHSEEMIRLMVDAYLDEMLTWRPIKESDEAYTKDISPTIPTDWVAKYVKQYVDQILRVREFLGETRRPV